jgi:hypothetical protein
LAKNVCDRIALGMGRGARQVGDKQPPKAYTGVPLDRVLRQRTREAVLDELGKVPRYNYQFLEAELVWERQRLLGALDETDPLHSDEADLDVMRKAIRETPDGAEVKPDVLRKKAGIAKKAALDALRELEQRGEYRGFSHRKHRRPAR